MKKIRKIFIRGIYDQTNFLYDNNKRQKMADTYFIQVTHHKVPLDIHKYQTLTKKKN